MNTNDLDIKAIRKKLGLTQKQLAEKLGVTPNTIQNWEYGGTIPKVKHQILCSLIERPNTSLKEQSFYGGDQFNQHGDNNTQVAGNANHVNSLSTIDKALMEIAEMRKLLAESIRNNKEQADRFFSIIEKMQRP